MGGEKKSKREREPHGNVFKNPPETKSKGKL